MKKGKFREMAGAFGIIACVIAEITMVVAAIYLIANFH